MLILYRSQITLIIVVAENQGVIELKERWGSTRMPVSVVSPVCCIFYGGAGREKEIALGQLVVKTILRFIDKKMMVEPKSDLLLRWGKLYVYVLFGN